MHPQRRSIRRNPSSAMPLLCELENVLIACNALSILTALLSRYYTISLILGTVALAYGSVPLYKMVRRVLRRLRDLPPGKRQIH